MTNRMTDPRLTEDDLIDDYLRGKLEPDALGEFEVRLLEDQDLFKSVQQRKAMITALDAERSTLSVDVSEPDPDPHSVSEPESVMREFRQWFRQPYSIAASMVSAVCVVMLVGSYLPGLGRGPSLQTVPVASNLTLETVRGTDPVISSSGTGPILLSIDVGPVAADIPFDVTIVDAGGNTVVRERSVTVDDRGWLRLLLVRDFSGPHRISVYSAGSADPLQSTTVEFAP